MKDSKVVEGHCSTRSLASGYYHEIALRAHLKLYYFLPPLISDFRVAGAVSVRLSQGLHMADMWRGESSPLLGDQDPEYSKDVQLFSIENRAY